MDNQLFPVSVSGVDVPVQTTSGHYADGIAFGQYGGAVFITITHAQQALYVRLEGDRLDTVAGLLADCIARATRAEHPELGTIQ